jgi:hypothetical protein
MPSASQTNRPRPTAIRALTPECANAIDQFGDYLADDLEGPARATFVSHLQSCTSCHDKLIVLELSLYLACETEAPDLGGLRVLSDASEVAGKPHDDRHIAADSI